MKPRACAVLVSALLVPASVFGEGRLDLDLFGSGDVRFTGGAAAPPPVAPAGALWVPGDPRDLRAAPKSVRILADSGYAAMGAVGAAQAVQGAGRSRVAKEEAGGFVAVALVGVWRLIRSLWN